MDRTRITRRELLCTSAALAGMTAVPISLAAAGISAPPAAEYFKHFGPLTKLSVEVAEAMPPDKYSYRPHADSMNFCELMSHLATTNHQFGAGLKDSDPPATPPAAAKDAIVKFLSDSFSYCSAIIFGLTDEQLDKHHDSPDGRLPGRDILLAMYVHVAHHRGQAEIYLRNNGIKPPSYMV